MRVTAGSDSGDYPACENHPMPSSAARTFDGTAAVPSPCTSVCTMNAADGLCIGCARTLEEIANWSGYSDAQKRAVLRLVAQRTERRAPR